MGDESAKSKGKLPLKLPHIALCTACVFAHSCTGLLTTLLSSGNTPGIEPRPKFTIRGGGGGDFLGQFKDEHGTTRGTGGSLPSTLSRVKEG
jgi:hypothetical protein